jgi:pyruvate ferredoxin oxidoreductase alpha subunit
MHKIVDRSRLAAQKPTVTQDLVGLNGDEATAYAAKQGDVDVVAAYPITPQTIIVERFSEFVANGEVDTEFICVESEHSAMSACVGASLTGARVFTATASQGLALMHEVLYAASGLRCPIIMAVANRALSAPINIHGDHSDMMGSRDCGWIQVFAENVQEAYDWTVQAFKIGEHQKVQLPVTVNLDGFTLTHAMEDLYVLKDDDVRAFLSTREPAVKVDPDNPASFGGLFLQNHYYEIKRQQEEAMRGAADVVDDVVEEYRVLCGREYGVIETFEMDDAEAAIMCMGSTAGTARSVVRTLRREGKKVGLVKIWLYRPFPQQEVVDALQHVKALAVMDRALSFGAPAGALCSDTSVALRNSRSDLKTYNVIYGLGGRDISPQQIEDVFNETLKVAETGTIPTPISFIGVRE